MKSLRVQGTFIVLGFLLLCTTARPQNSSPLALQKVIPLPHVAGRIDHMDVDLKTGRLFIAALGNNTVEVVSLKEGSVVRTLRGFNEPQGVLFLGDLNRLYVDNGGEGECAMLDGTSLERVETITHIDDADNIRYSPAGNLVYAGYGEGGIAVIEPAKGVILYRIPLPGHPESFQIESGGAKMYVNVPGERKIVVLDLAGRKVSATWALKDAESNFPMAIDESTHRLFVGCRAPARLIVLNELTGATVTSVRIGNDVDDVFFDAGRHRLYCSCGEGIVDVITQQDANTYRKISPVTTRKGARTSLFIPETGSYVVAVPASGGAGAGLRVYSVAGH